MNEPIDGVNIHEACIAEADKIKEANAMLTQLVDSKDAKILDLNNYIAELKAKSDEHMFAFSAAEKNLNNANIQIAKRDAEIAGLQQALIDLATRKSEGIAKLEELIVEEKAAATPSAPAPAPAPAPAAKIVMPSTDGCAEDYIGNSNKADRSKNYDYVAEAQKRWDAEFLQAYNATKTK